MTQHPYRGLPDRQIWRREPSLDDPGRFDPVSEVPFRIEPGMGVVTAGSCFAQHVGAALARSGLDYLITEPAPPIIPEALGRRFGYGLFSARYGNVYTPRQLRQLVGRATGEMSFDLPDWPAPDGSDPGAVVDPFRPRIQPGGFVSAAELAVDRVDHLAAVRRALEEMSVFVFTLGLTEAWEDRETGAVFPLAPGVAGGDWDPDRVRFRNFGLEETRDDLVAALERIRALNPRCRIVLTVSPVPLAATAEPRHVSLSTTWSKAVLRLAAEEVTRALPDCVYFPSYEIVTAPHLRGRYWEADARNVTPEGVAHVMGLFLHHFAGRALPERETRPAPDAARTEAEARARHVVETLCDEEAIDNSDPDLARTP